MVLEKILNRIGKILNRIGKFLNGIEKLKQVFAKLFSKKFHWKISFSSNSVS